jgi:acyl-CoA thioesterase-1
MNKSILNFILLIMITASPCPTHAANTILVFGDSLSAGYGIATEQSWPSLLQKELQREGREYRVINASISGETTSGGRQRIAGVLRQHRPKIMILELGANDGLRGLGITTIETNLNEIIKAARHSRASVLLVGMKLPPNYGETYIAQFEKIYPRLAKQHRIRLLPFLLEGVSAQQFQPDNLHPTAGAQPLLMRSVLKELTPLLH